jgi:hypothetical protein
MVRRAETINGCSTQMAETETNFQTNLRRLVHVEHRPGREAAQAVKLRRPAASALRPSRASRQDVATSEDAARRSPR